MSGTQGGERTLLLVRHTTRLEYADPVVEAYSEIRKTPSDTPWQRVVTSKLSVDPTATLRSYVDYFGTRVHYFNLIDPHDSLVVASESIVETRKAPEDTPEESDPDPRPWDQRWAEYLHWSARVPDLPHYAEIPHQVSTAQRAPAFLDALRELNEAFRTRFRYEPGTTSVDSTPEELFELGRGVCQDLAHALTGVLRRAGVPARYASGYILDGGGAQSAAPDAGSASHAWVQAWHPALGWIGVDPTHCQRADWQYVQVAVGRDYADVQPLRGMFVGTQEQTLNIDVQVSLLS